MKKLVFFVLLLICCIPVISAQTPEEICSNIDTIHFIMEVDGIRDIMNTPLTVTQFFDTMGIGPAYFPELGIWHEMYGDAYLQMSMMEEQMMYEMRITNMAIMKTLCMQMIELGIEIEDMPVEEEQPVEEEYEDDPLMQRKKQIEDYYKYGIWK